MSRDDSVSFRGLVNEGMTCYINSLLQALYSFGTFRALIYRLPFTKLGDTDQNSKSILLSLQRIFFNL